jgi:hypothetical protein
MRNIRTTLLVCGLGAAVILGGCSKDSDTTVNPPTTSGKTAVLQGSVVNGDRTLSRDTVYTVIGFYFVQPGSKLIIPAGTHIQGDYATKGAIITVRGTSSRPSGQIVAKGTPTDPIVFTSSQPEGQRKRADWGGVVLSGLADINTPGSIGVGEGGTGAYGWGNVLSAPRNNDSSGILEYCRIEYGGTKVTPDNEINGLTFNGVGTGTTIDHIQAHMTADDGYEWFGGTVNCKYLVSSGNDDDCFDMDAGFSGHLQFLFGIQDPDLGNRGFEIDNDANGSSNTPFTSAMISNVTLVGTGRDKANDEDNDGLYLRRNNKLKIYNAIVTNFRYALIIDGSSTKTNAANSDLVVKNSILFGRKATYAYVFKDNGGTTQFVPDSLTSIVAGWSIRTDDPGLTSIAFESPNPMPTANVTNGAMDPRTLDSWFESTNYIGAFQPGGTNWIAGWTNFKKS